MALAGSSIAAGYLAMGLMGGGTPVQHLLFVAGALGVTTATCAFASADHVRVYERTAACAGEIAALAERDGLTGTLNHRAFHGRLERETRRAAADHPGSLLVTDVDRFKDVNDAHGHPAGDGVLALVGGILTGLTRPGDSAGRLGGDEFTLLLPGTGTGQAVGIAERRQEQVRSAVAVHGATAPAAT